MTSDASPARYTATAASLHWLIALAILGTFSLGLYMQDLPISPAKLKLYSYHKWAGVTIFLLMLARLGWRITHAPPPLPAGMPDWQRRAAKGLHHLLYVLLFAIPLSGWLMSSAKGFQTVWFGVLPLPDLLTKDKALGETLAAVHQALNLSMASLVCVHVAAVVKHHVLDRERVLARMLPSFRNKAGS
ncbi:MAG: cytochrome b [Rhodocyclaceae bacterium]|nr:cytochrome b [Rhodocyclaceae bacterium]